MSQGEDRREKFQRRAGMREAGGEKSSEDDPVMGQPASVRRYPQISNSATLTSAQADLPHQMGQDGMQYIRPITESKRLLTIGPTVIKFGFIRLNLQGQETNEQTPRR